MAALQGISLLDLLPEARLLGGETVYGDDAKEMQLVGLKRSSQRKRPVRHAKAKPSVATPNATPLHVVLDATTPVKAA